MVDVLTILWLINGLVFFLIGILLVQIHKRTMSATLFFLSIASFIISGINLFMLYSVYGMVDRITNIRDVSFLIVSIIFLIFIYQTYNDKRGGDKIFKKILKIK